MGLPSPRRASRQPAMNVVETAPKPGKKNAELSVGGLDLRGSLHGRFSSGSRLARRLARCGRRSNASAAIAVRCGEERLLDRSSRAERSRAKRLNAEKRSTMGFWSGYWASLKPLEVEEPIDVYVHRPLAYIVARACFRAAHLARRAITLSRSWPGLASAASLVAEFPHHLQVGGGLLVRFRGARLRRRPAGAHARNLVALRPDARRLRRSHHRRRGGAGDRMGHVALARHTPVGQGHGGARLRASPS